MEFDKLKEIIATVMSLKPDCICAEMRLDKDLGMDSLAFFQMIMGIEIVYGITVEDEALRIEDTVETVLRYIQKSL